MYYIQETDKPNKIAEFFNIIKLENDNIILPISKTGLEEQNIDIFSLKPRSIVWVDFGQNIGSEIRKLRPAILWRSSSDKKMWTVIPLSSKCFNDKYYFHCDIHSLPCSTAKLESMANFSYKRIREPFFYNKKIAFLSNMDYEKILIALKKYYLFDN